MGFPCLVLSEALSAAVGDSDPPLIVIGSAPSSPSEGDNDPEAVRPPDVVSVSVDGGGGAMEEMGPTSSPDVKGPLTRERDDESESAELTPEGRDGGVPGCCSHVA